MQIQEILKFRQINENIFLVWKPIGPTSHDVVDYFRKLWNTRAVGHSGALDPFAEGLMIIGKGKGTKELAYFETKDKVYLFTALIGVHTESGDHQDKVTAFRLNRESLSNIESKLTKIINSFPEQYLQEVPLLSSVKVAGLKLREVFRSNVFLGFDNELDYSEKTRYAKFQKDNGKEFQVEVPKKLVNIKFLPINLDSNALISIDTIKLEELEKSASDKFKESLTKSTKSKNFKVFQARVRVSKGTYIRKLAEDMGIAMGTYATLVKLERTEIIT